MSVTNKFPTISSQALGTIIGGKSITVTITERDIANAIRVIQRASHPGLFRRTLK